MFNKPLKVSPTGVLAEKVGSQLFVPSLRPNFGRGAHVNTIDSPQHG